MARSRTANFARTISVRATILSLGLAMLALTNAGDVARAQRLSENRIAPKAGQWQRVSTAYRIAPGTRRVYHLTYESTSSSDLRAVVQQSQRTANAQNVVASNLQNAFHTTVQGDLVVTGLQQKADYTLLTCHFQQVKAVLQTNSPGVSEQQAALQHDLGRDVILRIDARGRIKTALLQPESSQIARSYTQTLLALLQFTLPSPGETSSPSWEAVEEDQSGHYAARYRAISATSSVYRKEIVRYLPAKTVESPYHQSVATIIQPSGSLTARFDGRQGHLIRLGGVGKQTILLGGFTVGHETHHITLQLLAQKSLSVETFVMLRRSCLNMARHNVAVSLSDPQPQRNGEIALQRRTLGEDRLPQLVTALAQLERVPAERLPQDQVTALYLKFKALIALHPEECAMLGHVLTIANPHGLTLRLLAGALGMVGSAEAQAALSIAIQTRPSDWVAQSLLVPALSQVERPTAQTEQTLRCLTRSSDVNVSNMAWMGLGIVAHSLADAAPARSTRLVALLLEQLHNAPSGSRRECLLLALGNTGARAALGDILHYTRDTIPEVRCAALQALSRQSDMAADRALAQALTTDTEATVRTQAIHVMRNRQMTLTLYNAQRQALLNDSSDAVRLTALQNMARIRAISAAANRLVLITAATDPSAEVRAAATNLLTQSAYQTAAR